MTAQVIHGDCMDVLAGMAANTVDAIVTDPPYEIGFMGKGWDGSGIAYRVELWAECLRVLKPGGHLLAFGGTRTYHRMTTAIDDAGFDVRDSLHWIYGSGFPKSLDVSKAIDKVNGEPNRLHKFTAWMRATGLTAKELDEITDTNMGGHYLTAKSQPAIPTAALWAVIRPHIADVPDWADELVARIEAEREVVGSKTSGIANKDEGPRHTIGASQAVEVDITAPATDAARQWAGYGTALKPAHEPIVVARKPLTGTVAATVLTHGTGALNIDGCRVGTADTLGRTNNGRENYDPTSYSVAPDERTTFDRSDIAGGRWPANLVFTHAHNCADTCADGCPVAELDEQSGTSKSGSAGTKGSDGSWFAGGYDGDYSVPYGDAGGASRFFTVTEWDPTADVPPFRYVPKPSKRERNAGLDGLEERKTDIGDESPSGGSWERRDGRSSAVTANHHPTVKPVNLLRWLVRLVTPPGGVVLDPFAGSGTTLVAATLEQFDSIGIELTDDYHPIIAGRLRWAETYTGAPHPPRAPTTPRTATPTTQPPLTLFDVGATE